MLPGRFKKGKLVEKLHTTYKYDENLRCYYIYCCYEKHDEASHLRFMAYEKAKEAPTDA